MGVITFRIDPFCDREGNSDIVYREVAGPAVGTRGWLSRGEYASQAVCIEHGLRIWIFGLFFWRTFGKLRLENRMLVWRYQIENLMDCLLVYIVFCVVQFETCQSVIRHWKSPFISESSLLPMMANRPGLEKRVSILCDEVQVGKEFLNCEAINLDRHCSQCCCYIFIPV